MAVDKNDPRPAYVQVADDLRRKIKSGRYEPGQRLPSGKALGDEFGVAYQTVVNALDVLKTEGIVVAHRTRGTFVASDGQSVESPSPEYVELKQHLDNLQAAIEELTGRLDQLEAAVHPVHPVQQPARKRRR